MAWQHRVVSSERGILESWTCDGCALTVFGTLVPSDHVCPSPKPAAVAPPVVKPAAPASTEKPAPPPAPQTIVRPKKSGR